MEKGRNTQQHGTQDQHSPGDSKETSTGDYSTCREDITEVEIASIQPCPIIPDFKKPTSSTLSIVVRTPTADFCIDGWHFVEQAKTANRTTIRCYIFHIAQHSDAELAIRKAAIRVMPQGGKCSYAELVRNTSRLRQALESTSDGDLVLFSHGGDRRGVGFTDSKENNIRVVLSNRLGKSPKTVSKYLQHSDGLNDVAMEELVGAGAPKQFFEAFQTQKEIGIAALRAEKKDDAAIVAEISSLVSAWWKESQQPVPPKTTTPASPNPPQPNRATGPTRPTQRETQCATPTPRSPQIDSSGNQDPPTSDPTPTNQEDVPAELKRIGEALIGIADNQESTAPQKIESVRSLIVDLSRLIQQFAQSVTQEGNEVGGVN